MGHSTGARRSAAMAASFRRQVRSHHRAINDLRNHIAHHDRVWKRDTARMAEEKERQKGVDVEPPVNVVAMAIARNTCFAIIASTDRDLLPIIEAVYRPSPVRRGRLRLGPQLADHPPICAL